MRTEATRPFKEINGQMMNSLSQKFYPFREDSKISIYQSRTTVGYCRARQNPEGADGRTQAYLSL